jgi:hypothetical protein
MKVSYVTRAWCSAVVVSAVLAGCGAAATSTDTESPDSPSAPPSANASDERTATHSTTGLQGADLHGVAASDDGMVAVGSTGTAAAWTSTDGMTWRPIEITQAENVPALQAVALGGKGVAFGAADPEPSRSWSASAGSRPWAPLESSGIDGRVNAVAMNGASWVAAGDLVDAETGTATAGAVWISDDGQRWEQSTELPLNEGTISDVAIAGDMVVVGGFDIDGGKVWASTNGGHLERVDDGQFSAITVEGITHTDAGYLALGRTLGDLRPVAFTSPDGVAWRREDLSTDAFPPDLQINDLTTFRGAPVAVGSAPDGGVVWTSNNGTSWTLHRPASE